MSVKERSRTTDEKEFFRFPFVHRLKQLDTLIPPKFQKGFSTFDIAFTCLDATHNYLAVGTNIGITYLFDRTTGHVQKLKCEGSTCPVSCISCLETVDLMVAMGTSVGLIIVFQIPLLNDPRPGGVNQIKQYLITDLHLHSITCLTWSPNGMNIFSGDKKGLVANTNIDYIQDVCKSTELLQEQHSITQICHHQKLLLVSTLQRTILCSLGDHVTVCQVGQKDRKSLEKFGACFYSIIGEPQQSCIYASRPSLRLWKANLEGKVLETFIFSDDLIHPSCNISLGDHINASTSKLESQFGIILRFMEHFLVSWNESKIYVITLEGPTVVGKCDEFSNINSLAVCEDEIFIIDGQRNVIRIAHSSDHSVIQMNVKEEAFLSSLNFVPSALKDIELMLKGTNVGTNIFNKLKPKMSPFQNKSSISNSGLEVQLMRIEPTDCDVSQESIPSRSDDKGFKTSDVEIVYQHKPGKICKPKPTEDLLTEQPVKSILLDLPDESESGVLGKHSESKDVPVSDAVAPLNDSIQTLPDVEEIVTESSNFHSNENSLPNDRRDKEWRLAKLLNIKELSSLEEEGPSFPEIPTINNYQFPLSNPMDLPEKEEPTEVATYLNINSDKLNPKVDLELNRDENCNISLNEQRNSLTYSDIYCSNYMGDGEQNEGDNETSIIPASECCSSYLSYGPPSGSSNINSLTTEANVAEISSDVTFSLPLLPQLLKKNLLRDTDSEAKAHSLPPDLINYSPNPSDVTNSVPNGSDQLKAKYNSVWIQHKPPGYLRSLSVCDQYIVCTDVKDIVYYTSFGGLGLEWHKTNYFASQICVSPSGKRVWRIYDNSAFALEQPSDSKPFGTNWIQMGLNVAQVSVHENWVWYVMHNGDVFCQSDLSDYKTYSRPVHVTCGSKVVQVVCDNDIVWALTSDKKLLSRLGITINTPVGSCWQEVSFRPTDVLVVAMGIPSTAWVVDGMSKVWFKSDVAAKVSSSNRWWQVNISDYVYQNSSSLQSFTATLKESLHPEQLSLILNRYSNPILACSKSRGVWYYHPQQHQIMSIQSGIVGHHWHNVTFSENLLSKWKMMTASGVYHHHGVIWLWNQGSNLYGFNPTSMTVTPVKLPDMCQSSQPICLGAAPEALWLLTESGRIAIRKDITALNATGTTWVELDLMQISSHKLVHISCGSNLVWACNSKGSILMRIGSLQAPSIPNFPPAWMEVETEQTASGVRPFFVKVYVGPLDYTVWAIDNKSNIYVREGIFPELLIGLGWVPVSGIQAVDLVISEQGVYALTPNNTVFRRYNISQNNYIGDYWMELPGQVKHLSVTVNDSLWALSLQDDLLQHFAYTPPVRSAGLQDEQGVCQNAEDDWEMIEGCL